MQVSVETLSGLERKIIVVVPAIEIEERVSSQLKNLAKTVKMDGFRSGKVPMSMVRKNYLHSAQAKAADEVIRKTLPEVITSQNLNIVDMPNVEPQPIKDNEDFTYWAFCEVFPKIEIQEFDKDKVEIIKSEVTGKDVENTISQLIESRKEWSTVKRAVKEGDKVTIDFEGTINGDTFAGGTAQDFEIEIGSNRMIPGFEKGIIGAEITKPVNVKVTFPKDYDEKSLQGKKANFKITVNKVEEGKLPTLDDKFVKNNFDIKKGGVDAFKEEIKANMISQLERQVSSQNRDAIFTALAEKNKFDLPTALVDKEIKRMEHDFYHRVFGKHPTKQDKNLKLPREMFVGDAEKRVRFGLLFAEYLNKTKLEPDTKLVDAMLEKIAESYQDPEEVRTAYRSSDEKMENLKALVLEEMVAEKLLETAKVVEKKLDYDKVVNKPEQA